MFPISYRDLELMLQDRGVAVDHTTIFRWIQAYAPKLEKRIRPDLLQSLGPVEKAPWPGPDQAAIPNRPATKVA